jgi:hypothetical protein
MLNKYSKNSFVNKIYSFSLNITAEASKVGIISDVI